MSQSDDEAEVARIIARHFWRDPSPKMPLCQITAVEIMDYLDATNPCRSSANEVARIIARRFYFNGSPTAPHCYACAMEILEHLYATSPYGSGPAPIELRQPGKA